MRSVVVPRIAYNTYNSGNSSHEHGPQVWSADGTRLLYATRRCNAGEPQSCAARISTVYDVNDPSIIPQAELSLSYPAPPSFDLGDFNTPPAIMWSQDSSHLLLAADNRVEVYEVFEDYGDLRFIFLNVSEGAFSPNGQFLRLTTPVGERIVDLREGSVVLTLEIGHTVVGWWEGTGEVVVHSQADFNPGYYLMDVSTRECTAMLHGRPIHWSEDGRFYVTRERGVVRLFEREAGR
jgi:hypothetical protein